MIKHFKDDYPCTIHNDTEISDYFKNLERMGDRYQYIKKICSETNIKLKNHENKKR